MLIVCVLIYMAVTVAIGLYASSRVKDSKDFMVAGRSLPLYMNFACVFATWFGAETALSVSAKFADQGLGFVSGDPFGASVCLILVALFFARTFYRLELMTIGDYYHVRYGRFVEVIASLGIASSYLGWTSAQLSALGLVINVLFPEISLNEAIVIGAVIVTIYTMFGGMWSVALTDVVQTAAIVIGLIVVAVLLGNRAGGFEVVLKAAADQGKLNLFPHVTTSAWMIFIGEFLTMSLGSIPQQDVFQRVTSAKDERTAMIGTFAGGLFYFGFAFVPMFIAFSSTIINSEYIAQFQSEDAREVQKILPLLILHNTPIAVQVLFFGALLSAILSTASGTLLAPASILTENVLQQFTRHFSDRTMLWLLRGMVVGVAILGTSISVNTESTMYEMVESGYKVTLVIAFVPLVCGIYWSRATTQGAVFSILFALPVWLAGELGSLGYDEESDILWQCIPPQLYGLAASFVGMFIGSSMPNWIKHQQVDTAELLKEKRSVSTGH
jgi:SSS family solute:Na+ symporter